MHHYDHREQRQRRHAKTNDGHQKTPQRAGHKDRAQARQGGDPHARKHGEGRNEGKAGAHLRDDVIEHHLPVVRATVSGQGREQVEQAGDHRPEQGRRNRPARAQQQRQSEQRNQKQAQEGPSPEGEQGLREEPPGRPVGQHEE